MIKYLVSEMSYPDLPKEILDLIDSYGEEKGLLPYLVTENVLDKLPKELQGVIADYLTPATYRDLIILDKINKSKVEQYVRDLIKQPLSNSKIDRAISIGYWPIISEAFLENPTNLNRTQKAVLFDYAMDIEDYHLALLVGRSDPSIFNLTNSLRNLVSYLNYLSDSGIAKLEYRDYKKAHRRANFLADHFVMEIRKQGDPEYLHLLAKEKWLDVLDKIGKFITDDNPSYLGIIVQYPILDQEFSRRLKNVMKMEEPYELFYFSGSRNILANSYDINRHLALIKEAGNLEMLNTILDLMKANDPDRKQIDK